MSAIAIPLLIFVKSEPEFPPDTEARRLSLAERPSFRNTLKRLFSNKNYVLLIIPFSMLFSVYMALGAIVSLLC